MSAIPSSARWRNLNEAGDRRFRVSEFATSAKVTALVTVELAVIWLVVVAEQRVYSWLSSAQGNHYFLKFRQPSITYALASFTQEKLRSTLFRRAEDFRTRLRRQP